MATPVFHNGRLANATFNGTDITLTDWVLGQETDITVFKNSGILSLIPQYEGAWQSFPISMKIDRDYANNPWGSPLNLAPALQLTNVILYEHQSAPGQLDGPFWSFANGIVKAVPLSANVNGMSSNSIALTGFLYGAIVRPIS